MEESSVKDERSEHFENLKKSWKRLIVRMFLIFVLSAIGGFAFRWAEGSKELEYKCGIKKVRRDFVESLWQGSRFMNEDDWKTVARRKLLKFEDELHNAYESGMDADSGTKTWNFLNSMFYSMTIMTTIGYGHISVTTFTGKILTLAYAMISIPICTIIITDAMKFFTLSLKYNLTKKEAHRKDYNVDEEFNFPLKTAFIVLFIYCAIGAIFFYFLETDWGILDSLYFIFITNSTVGFGDYIPSTPLIAILTSIYFLFGLALTASVIGLVQERVEEPLESLTKKFGILYGDKSVLAEEETHAKSD